MSDNMNDLYEVNPFAGVICKKCQYPLTAKKSLFIEIYQHERQNVNHDTVSSAEERKRICKTLYDEIDRVVRKFSRLRDSSDDEVLAESVKYLHFPSSSFWYCSLCQKNVFDKTTHKGGRHYQSCIASIDGYRIINWSKNDPGIMSKPFDIKDPSLFSSIMHFAKQSVSTEISTFVTPTHIRTNRITTANHDSEAPLVTPAQTMLDHILEHQNIRFDTDVTTQVVEVIDQKAEPDLWIRYVGYDEHLHGIARVDWYHLASQRPKDEEAALSRILRRVSTVTKKAVEYAKSIDRSNLVLFVVKRIDFRPALRPFNPNLQKDTWDRYTQVIRHVITVVVRIECDARRNLRRYKLTAEQRTLIYKTMDDDSDVETDETYIKMMLSLLRQPFADKSYDSALLTAIAVMSIRRDGTFRDPNETTQFYAALIAVFRTFILYSSKHFPSHDDSTNRINGNFIGYVRSLTEELMIHPAPGSNPGPMSWILNAFSYAKSIIRESVNPGNCYWDDDVLIFKNIHFSMADFRLMIAQYISKCKELLAELLFLGVDYTSVDFPTIPWNKFIDDISNTSAGYSFLTEPKNEWIASKKDFLFNKVRTNKDLSDKWCNTDSNKLDKSTLRRYGHLVDKLREYLLGLIHITAGQPARGTEITNLRYVNSSTPRNICVDRGVVCIRTTYHKMMQQTGKGKNIYRYLPLPVGELLIYYLWLVLPFWQTTVGWNEGYRTKSIYVWSKELIYPEPRAITSEDLWNSTKLSNILLSMFRSSMGVDVTVSIWRQMAVAISRRFLRQSFTDPSDGDDHVDDDGEEDIRNLDVLYDRQMAHSSAVANRVYAPLMGRSVDTPMNIIDGYRCICFEWHGLLLPEYKQRDVRHNDVDDIYRTFMLRIRQRRLHLLATMDASSQLRLFMNHVGAEFRGNQREVIEAVTRGDPCILQVAPTGVGKSLSYLLPSFVSREGTSVVIVPLISLQNDMVRRCKQLGISATAWDTSQLCVHVTIVFVTPESAMTQSFYQYLTMLLYSHKLDRIVVDECHTMLSGNEDFRPKLQAIRETIRFTGVQILLLTATLPPSQETELFRIIGTTSRQVTAIRQATTRSNIRYIVQSIPKRDHLIEFVSASVKQYIGDGKCIVYCRSIQDGDYLSSKTGWQFYNSTLGSAYEKEKMMTDFVCRGNVIIATNALGLGIDIPNIRLVLHVGSPKSLLDFAQESGRAGRDGRGSFSVLLHFERFQIDNDMYEFVHTNRCRRCTIDRVMDGNNRTTCCNGEESLCDRCFEVIKTTETRKFDNCIELEGTQQEFDSGNELDDETLVHVYNETVGQSNNKKHTSPLNSYEPPSKKAATASHIVSRRMAAEQEQRLQYRRDKSRDQNEIDNCREMLDEIAGSKCIFCTLKGTNFCDTSCSVNRKILSAKCKDISLQLKFPKYSACFISGCYVPQAMCNHWEENSSGFQATMQPCRYRNVLLNTIYSICILDPKIKEELDNEIRKSGARDEKTFFVQAVRWHGMQTTRLFLCFFGLLRRFRSK